VKCAAAAMPTGRTAPDGRASERGSQRASNRAANTRRRGPRCRKPLWCCFIIAALIATAFAAEPIAGTWLLKGQQVNGRESSSQPLTLRITQSGDLLEFAYSVPNARKQDVSLRFAARPDGSPADVRNSEGRKIGTAKVTRGGPSEYRVMLEGPNRPTSSGKLTLSSNGRTLTSVSDATAPGGDRLHTVQTFERQ